MPRYRIVIREPEVEARVARDRNREANVKRNADGRKIPVAAVRADSGFMHKLNLRLDKQFTPRAAGTIHTVADTECPDGGSNCRNCGDPLFAEQCVASGHCPYCGTRHGIAPTNLVIRGGYELQEIPEGEKDVEENIIPILPDPPVPARPPSEQ